ncbi:hypothetical protein IWW48_003076 [Coemansia sp. RSA 1200]|nr:hypothetical protein IWW48_003076 [Coemansia sp. RSA 1200]
MSQEEPALTRDQITAQELALIQQVRGLEIRREQHVQRPGSHPPLGLIKYDNRRYLEVRQGFQPILVPDHMVTIVRTFLAQNLPQHVQALREREQSPPNTPRSMTSVTSGITNLAMASDLRLPAAQEPNGSRFMVSRYQLTRPPEAAPSVFTQPRSLPLSELDPSQFGQLHSTSEPLSPPPDEMGLSPHNMPTLPYAESSLFTTVASQGLYDHINAAASFMTSIPGVSLPNTAAGSMADAIPSTPVATAAAASVPNGNMGLMSSPPQSLSSSYSNPHPFGGSFFPAPVDREETGSLPQLSLGGSAKPTNHTRKISASSQRKTSRSITRKQATMPYPDTSAVKESAGLRNSAPKNDDLDSTMDVDDGYDGDGNGNNDDNMSTSSYGNNNNNSSNNSSNNSKTSKRTTVVAAEAGKKADDKRSALSEDIEDDEQPLRKPPNAFILYRRMKNARLRAERPGISVEAASGVIGKYWREEPEEVKREFHQLANKAREVYFAKKKRMQARQKQRRLEREEQQQQQQQQHKGPGSGGSSRQKPSNVPLSKPKRKVSKSLSSPAQSLVVSSSRGLSSFSPETLAKKRPASTDFLDLGTADPSASPLVRMTRSLTDTSGSDKKQGIHQSLAMPEFSFSPQHQQFQHQHQQSIGMLSTLLEHKVEPGSSNSQPGSSLGEVQASPDIEQHVSATVATLQQAFDDVTRTQQMSPVASSMDMGAGSPPWSADSQTAEKDGWEGMLSSLFQRNN